MQYHLSHCIKIE